MVDQVTPSEFVFQILYKKKGFKPERATYTSPDLNRLLIMLMRTEDIGVRSTEMLIIHQLMPDGTVMEVMSHDVESRGKETGSNIIPFKPRDVTIMETVRDALAAARESSKVKSLVPLKHKVTTGYKTYAYEARSGDEYA